METIRFENANNSRILIKTIGGDLRITGRSGGTFEAQAPERGRMVARQKDDLIELDSRSSCLVFVPEDAALEVESIGGDGRITGVQEAVSIGTVGGDLTLRRMKSAEVKRVGGDADVRRIEENLQIAWIGGDALLERIDKKISIESVGGDIKLRKCTSVVEAAAGGDILLDMDVPAGSKSNVRAGGDLMCILPEQVSAKLQLLAGGDLLLSSPQEIEHEDGEAEAVFGAGEADLLLQSGGDMIVRVGRKAENDTSLFGPDFMSDLDATLEEADQRIAEVEARLSAAGLGFSLEDTDRIGTEVRKAVARAMRRKGRSRGHHRSASKSHKFDVSFDIPGSSTGKPTEEEKLSILKMVEEGTISIEEADMLLQALEGKV